MKKLNKTEWLFVSIILLIIFAIASNFWNFANYLMLVPMAYIVAFSFVMIYNGVKNFIKDLK